MAVAAVGSNAEQDVGAVTPETAPAILVALGLAYEHGEGVRKDPLKAAALYCEAARDGNPEAQFSLGWMYANGRGVARDDAIAASLFARAAAAGHAHARNALAFVSGDHSSLPDCMRPREPPPAAPDVAPAPVLVETPEPDPDPFAALPPWKRRIADVVDRLAPAYSVNPRLALAVIAVESNFDPAARSEKDARGLMQLVPQTAARFSVRDRHDVTDNVRGGLAYLRWLLAYYRGQVQLAAAAYNAGEAAVDKYRGIPPYPETRDYVRRVMRLFRSEMHPYDARIVEPSPFLTRSDAGPS
ncbi:MAG: transglycosylase SLT domain-containing protein [Aromatoleum sp.]|nr:transglycosylase SLT domain-containing protein [Aromatoleum sp.]